MRLCILGVSSTSLFLELFSYTIMMLYNYTYAYSLLSYLEYPILLVQEYVLVALVLKYKNMLNQNSFISIGAYFAVVLLFAYQICPRFLLAMAVVSINELKLELKIIFNKFVMLKILAILHTNWSYQQSNSTP